MRLASRDMGVAGRASTCVTAFNRVEARISDQADFLQSKSPGEVHLHPRSLEKGAPVFRIQIHEALSRHPVSG
jgi:hypothetical protein